MPYFKGMQPLVAKVQGKDGRSATAFLIPWGCKKIEKEKL